MLLKPNQQAPDARVYSCSSCGYLNALLKDELAPNCPNCEPTKKKYYWKGTQHEIILRTKNIAEEIRKRSTFADKISDEITAFCGNMTFVYVHIAWFAIWIWYNLTSLQPFDPFPFGLLTMIVSLEAILLATFILISQNRQGEISDVRAELDYQIDSKSEKMITELRAMQQQIYNAVIKRKK